MIHQDYLATLLRPLGVYDLREGTVNRGELEAYGVRLDHMAGELEDTARRPCCASAGTASPRRPSTTPCGAAASTPGRRRADSRGT